MKFFFNIYFFFNNTKKKTMNELYRKDKKILKNTKQGNRKKHERIILQEAREKCPEFVEYEKMLKRKKYKTKRKRGRKKKRIKKNFVKYRGMFYKFGSWRIPEGLNYTKEQILDFAIEWKFKRPVQVIYHLMNNDKELKLGICKVCNKKRTSFISLEKGYRDCCSRKCAAYVEEKREKSRQTLINTARRLYGVEPVSGKAVWFTIPELREKIKRSTRKKYGFSYPLQNPNILAKTRETMKKKYGDGYFMRTKKYKRMFKKYKNIWLKKNKEKFEEYKNTIAWKIKKLEAQKKLLERLTRDKMGLPQKRKIFGTEIYNYKAKKILDEHRPTSKKYSELSDKEFFDYLIYEELMYPEDIIKMYDMNKDTFYYYAKKHGYTISKIKSIVRKEREKLEEMFDSE